ncbi:MAG: GumC family protein [Rectinema subterraneum]|uniref:GumC family protein n=1 Tax=Rectinema subterraneum TaxID=2653714 RepID=UPI003C7E7BC0
MTDQNGHVDTMMQKVPASQPGVPSQNPEDDDEISLVDLAAVLWKRKWLIVGVTLAAAIAVLAYTIGSLILPPEESYLPNVYTSKATMLIQTGGSSSLAAALSSSGLANLAGLSATAGNTNGALAEVLATSNSTLDALNAKFNFAERNKARKPKTKNEKPPLISDIRESIKKNLSAKLDTKTNLFVVSYTDPDPAFAKEVVDEVVRLLSERFAVLGGNKALEQKALLEKKLAEVDTAVKNLEAQVKAFQNKYGVIQVEALATEQITILARLRSELIMKEMEIANYQKISNINDPVMTQLKNERDGILAKIKEIETGVGSGSRVMPSQKELPTIAFEYARLQRDLAVQTEVFKMLTQQYELAKLNASGQEPVFQILEMAEVPDKKSGPSRGMICIVATLAAFFLSILLAFIAESIEKIRKDPETVARFKAISSGKESM